MSSPFFLLPLILFREGEGREKKSLSIQANQITSCYNNCPNDPRASTAQGQVTQFCALASQYASTNTASATGSAAKTSSTATATSTDDSSATSIAARPSSSGDSSSSANSAADLVMGAGGLLAAVAGVMGALL